MSLIFDTRRAPLTQAEFSNLITAISQAEATDETVWLEWKSHLDLSARPGRAAVARCILGMANRLPEIADRFCEGRGFLVVGASEAGVVGVPVIDSADFEPAIAYYFSADRPRWVPHWIRVSGVDVLVIEVASPAQGDPIFVAGKNGDGIYDGAIYVRRTGATERANSTEISGLLRRLQGGRQIADLSIAITGDGLQVLDFSRSATDEWLDAERDFLLRPLNQAGPTDDASSDVEAAAARALQKIHERHSSVLSALGKVRPESRTPEEYRELVASYIDECADALRDACRKAVPWTVRTCKFEIKNGSEANYHSLLVRAHVPGRISGVKASPRIANESNGLPKRPRLWGPTNVGPDLARATRYVSIPQMVGPPIGPRPPSLKIQNGGSVELTFPEILLRPLQTQVLGELILYTDDAEIVECNVSWTATASNIDGLLEGSASLELGSMWSPSQCLNRSNAQV